MTREARTIFLTVLTLVIYAVSIFLEKGAIIFPFPLNQALFLGVTLAFTVFNFKKKWKIGVFSIIASTCWLLSTQFFWTFIYGHDSLEFMMNNLTTDYFLLAFYVLLLIAGVFTLVKQKSGIATLLGVIFILCLILGSILNNPYFILTAFISMAISTQSAKAYQPYHLLWVLLAILKLSELLTFVLNS